jgi:hypothetical protein
MAAHIATLNKPTYNSSTPVKVKWSSFASGANNIVFNCKAVDASKLVILVAGCSTLEQNLWVGTSDSRSSGAKASGMYYPFSAAKLGRMKIKTTAASDAHLMSKFRSTVAADTEVFGIICYGPFETARFKDSDGYINVCRGKVTAGGASHSSDTFYIAGILIP